MLPLILGGIALAAVGYGEKEICESEGCPWEERPSKKTSKSSENLFKKVERKKRKLHESLLPQFKEHLLAIEHKKKWKLEESATLTYTRV